MDDAVSQRDGPVCGARAVKGAKREDGQKHYSAQVRTN